VDGDTGVSLPDYSGMTRNWRVYTRHFFSPRVPEHSLAYTAKHTTVAVYSQHLFPTVSFRAKADFRMTPSRCVVYAVG